MSERYPPWPIQLLKVVAALLMGLYLVHLFVAGHDNVTTPPPAPERTAVDVLLDRYDCDLPEGTIPGHAVVTLPNQSASYMHADVGFAIWEDGAPGTLHAFCE